MRYVGTKDESSDFATQGDIGGGGGGGGAIIGEIKMWPTAAPPGGYLVCNGAAVSRSTYSDLFSLVGTTYGAGDGSTTFNLPNFTDRFPRGGTPGATGGSETKTLTVANLAQHNHGQPTHVHNMDHDHPDATAASDGSHSHVLSMTNSGTGQYPARGGAAGNVVATGNQSIASSGAHTHNVPIAHEYRDTGFGGGDTTYSTGSTTPFDVMNPYLGITFIIKAT